MSTDEQSPEGASVPFVYHVCNEIGPMRRFYVECLGLAEKGHMDREEFGWLAVGTDTFQMMWFRADETQPVPDAFACQPGWGGGTLERTSWSVKVPEAAFPGVLERLRAAGAPFFEPDPAWRQDSYWGVSVRDPMGATVEVYTVPAARPSSPTWPG